MPGQPNSELDTAAAIIVLDPNTQPSNLIVDEDLKFSVAMEFTVTGMSTVLLGYLTFEVLYYYESIGRGPEGTLGATLVLGGLVIVLGGVPRAMGIVLSAVL